MIIPVKDPKHAVEIITSRTLPVELKIPHAVNTESFKQGTCQAVACQAWDTRHAGGCKERT